MLRCSTEGTSNPVRELIDNRAPDSAPISEQRQCDSCTSSHAPKTVRQPQRAFAPKVGILSFKVDSHVGI